LIQFGFSLTELAAMELSELAFWSVTTAGYLRGGDAPERGGNR
jgi:hypothetical protein